MGGNAILYQGRIFIKDGLDNDMTAKKRILAFEIGTFFTRYVVFEDGRVYAVSYTHLTLPTNSLV